MREMHYPRIMRTTISIDDHVHDAAKRRARERGMTLGELVEDGLRLELARAELPPGPPVPVFEGKGGFKPGVDVTSNRALNELLDEGVPLEKRRW